MTDAFQEVEESLRNERAAKLWKRAFPWVVVGVVAIVGAVGISEFLRWQHTTVVEKDATQFAAAVKSLQESDMAGAKTKLEAIAKDNDGYGVLANNVLAGVEDEQTKDAAAMAKRLEAAAKGDSAMNDVSLLKLAYVKADSITLAELTTLVKPLVDGGGTGSALARELIAAKTLESGDVETARRSFQQLTLDLDAPQAMKQRVQQIIYALPPAKVDAAPATAPAATPAPATAPAPAKPEQAKPQ